VSKRHQSNRRRSYGRRQHELAERRQHDLPPDAVEQGFEELVPVSLADRFAFLDPRTVRLSFAVGD
jgi:hypothetical protein